MDPYRTCNATAGNISTSARTFNNGASYGFVGNGAMVSGSALPSQVVGLYVYKNTAGDLVTLTNPVEVTSKLKFQNGIIKTNANLVNVSNSATTAIEGGNLTGTDKYVQGNLQRNTDGASSYTFPIGHASQNAQGFTIGVTGANNSTIKGFLETNNQTLVQSIAYCDIEKHSGTAGVENAGEGLSGYDGILDRITFNLKSPLQWDVVNPSGGITSYDITVSANGGQDITPVVSSNALPIRYLMKNGEPGNTGYSTGTGAPSFTATGFLACPNGYTLTGMTSFSKFTVNGADQDNTVLPIELIYFDATCDKEGYVDLNWSTASELNNDYYTIERSRDAVSFEQVKEVDAAVNSGNILAYNEKDESPILGTSYYRLKQTDLDGSFSYSKIVRVDCTTGGDESINVFYADGEGIVSTIFINNGERFNFSIYDDLGRIIYEEKRNIGEGFSRNLLNNKDLATGIYFVTAQSENRRVSVKLFVP
ncbi:MAG: T9SS type A sorting domain-containing protein [Bacteroidetes bacterium]|nr:T9SS type A sorting domain-containing protein [Bacteroidota bacterium]